MTTMLSYLKARIDTLRDEEEGATMIEYGLLAALIAVALIATIILVSQALDGTFTDVKNGLEGSGGA